MALAAAEIAEGTENESGNEQFVGEGMGKKKKAVSKKRKIGVNSSGLGVKNNNFMD